MAISFITFVQPIQYVRQVFAHLLKVGPALRACICPSIEGWAILIQTCQSAKCQQLQARRRLGFPASQSCQHIVKNLVLQQIPECLRILLCWLNCTVPNGVCALSCSTQAKASVLPWSDQTGSDQTGSDQTGSDQTGWDQTAWDHIRPDRTTPKIRKNNNIKPKSIVHHHHPSSHYIPLNMGSPKRYHT